MEKFGRKDTAYPHSDDQGIGTNGTGITTQLYDMLSRYKCNEAASTLLSGNVPSDLTSQPKILPPWVPMTSKLSASTGSDLMMQVLSSGDSDLAEYIRHPDRHEAPGTG